MLCHTAKQILQTYAKLWSERRFSFKEKPSESFGLYIAAAAYLSPPNECTGTVDLTIGKEKSSLATGLLNSGSPWHQSIFTSFTLLRCSIIQLESKTSFEIFFVDQYKFYWTNKLHKPLLPSQGFLFPRLY